VGHCFFCAVDELEEHGVGDVEAGESVESAGWHDHFSAVVYVLSFWAGQHGDWIASVVFVETLGWSCSADHAWVHASSSHHGVLVEAGVELGGC